MLRKLLAAAVLAGLMVGRAAADDLKATIIKVDPDKNTVVVKLENKDEETTFPVNEDARIYRQDKGKKNKPGPDMPIQGGLKALKEGTPVTLTTIQGGSGKDVVIAIKVEGPPKKLK